MKISIAMTTYNGAKYLQEQLDSFALQTRLPDELIVCDDVSTDGTVEILERFAQLAPFRVKVVVNEKNIGCTSNFEQAISFCNGDVIFLSDQDDVWFKNKLEFIENIFVSNVNLMVVINDQEITDQFLTPSGLTIFSNTRALGFRESWLSAGCCTAIRAGFIDIFTPFPRNLAAHDDWIHRVAQAFGVRKVVPEVLQYYRRHDLNVSSSMASTFQKPNKLTHLKSYGLKDVTPGWLKEVEVSEHLLKILVEKKKEIEKLNFSAIAESICVFERKKNVVIKKRINLINLRPLNRLLPVVLFYISGNYKYFSGWKSALKDVIR